MINIVPNIFIPTENYLNQPIPVKFKTFLYIGKLMILKGLVDICKAIPIVLKKYPYIKFIFVGQTLSSPLPEVNMDDFLRKNLKEYLNNVIFTGKVEPDQVSKWLSKSDALIIPSLWENFPTVCLEAMSAGKLVIGNKTGGINEIIDSTCGLLTKRKNSKNLANKIIYAIKNPKKMEKLALNGRNKIAKRFSQEIVGKKMEDIYNKIIR